MSEAWSCGTGKWAPRASFLDRCLLSRRQRTEAMVKIVEKTEFPDSSVIRGISYSLEERDLEVRFVSGAVYLYYDVPWDVVDGFKDAASKGGYFHDEILDRYRFDRLN